ncbi:transcriptional regulator, Crp/Fnr family [Thioalkalivibrio sp. K90mix]|uniref:fumarate/nitrate reduction transcriptional regulator Fnr n=1 Tax=unclassified Thioalkalivibrio TaxID=2621013 RepID=UPI000195A7E0|nr:MULTISPECIES: fumarate/nitrate reduction transcriptional regulator Fnr [unclassified Thioalkalivibrio]ADC71302.1 transcriptional regulator, Crp/Fnr family [Thioalkalivibrio sp. K90mix]
MTLRPTQACEHCTLRQLCLPMGLPQNELWQLDEIVQQRRPIEKGALLFNMGERFETLFAVRTGALKAVLISDDGTEQITGFAFAGDLLGLDAIHSGKHPVSAVALESTSVCAVPYAHVDDLADRLPTFRQHMMKVMSKELAQDESLHTLLGQRTAEQRLATFLVTLSERHRARGLSPERFYLPMSRADIANHLGLTQETISRLFTQLRKQGVISLRTRDLEILEPNSLRNTAGVTFTPAASSA